MNTDFDEATWVAERLPEVDEPDGMVTDRTPRRSISTPGPAFWCT